MASATPPKRPSPDERESERDPGRNWMNSREAAAEFGVDLDEDDDEGGGES